MDMGKGTRARLAQTVRLLRTVRGLTQEELASASGLHRTYISLIERAECSITIDNLERLAATFGITPAEILSAMDPVDAGKQLLASLNKTTKRKRHR